MSEEKEGEVRIYTIPLAKAWLSPKHRRAERAINIIREFAEKHMKSSEVKISTSLNELIWRRGITSPPRRVTVKMEKDEKKVVTVGLASQEEGATEA